MRLTIVAAIFVAALATSTTARAQDYCSSGGDLAIATPIPVVLSSRMSADLCTPGYCPSMAELERTVKVALMEWYTASGSTITTDDGAAPKVKLRRIAGSTWVSLRDVVTVATHPPAVAQASNSVIHVAYPYINSLTTHQHRINSFKTTDGGVTWTPLTELTTSSTRTRHAGVATTYDFATGRFVTLWLGSGGGLAAIYYRVEGSSQPYLLVDDQGNPIRSAGTPSIACGQTSVVGSENCLIAWTNIDSWYRTTLWTQGHISGETLVIPAANPIRTHSFSTSAPASVAYVGGLTYPWQIVLTQGSATQYTWRKGPTHASSWVDQRSFAESPLPTPGAAGGLTGSRWIFVTDE